MFLDTYILGILFSVDSLGDFYNKCKYPVRHLTMVGHNSVTIRSLLNIVRVYVFGFLFVLVLA